MDELSNMFDEMELDLCYGDRGEEWRTVTPRSRTINEPPTGALIASHKLPFNIYQIPRLYTDQQIIGTVEDVIKSGSESLKLLRQVAQDTCPKLLILLRGVPGTGKSHVAASLMAITRKGVICSADHYFTDGRGNYVFYSGRLKEAHDECLSKCRKSMEKEISPIIIDNTNTKRWEMEPYVKQAVLNNYHIIVFAPETPWRADAKQLAAKNCHGVPKEKIEDSLSKYEEVSPNMLIKDVIREMGPAFGDKYDPIKFLDVKQPRPSTAPAALALTALPSLVTDFRFQGPLNVPPPRNLFDYVPTKLMKDERELSPRMAANFPTHNYEQPKFEEEEEEEEEDDTLIKIETLHSFFPSSKIEQLFELLEKFDGNMDTTMNHLLDSHHLMAKEEEGVAAAAAIIDEENDGPDWLNLTLPQNAVVEIVNKYGDLDDPKMQALLTKEEGVTFRVPPNMGFDFYAKILDNFSNRMYEQASNVVKEKEEGKD